VARVEALTASGDRLMLGLSLGLLAGENGQPGTSAAEIMLNA
jgi:hypothetical protein